MGSTKNVDMSATDLEVKIVEAVDESQLAETPEESAKPVKKDKPRSARYRNARAQVDKTRLYDPFSAIELVKRLSYSSFEGTLTAHFVVRETGMSFDMELPHKTGKSLNVVIASDEVLQQIEDGNTDFDVLLTTKEFMPKITKYARILGPQGLMPNPKNGTLTPNPEAKKKELEAGRMTVKTEKKAPLMHIVFGKTSMDTKDLVENLQTLIDSLKTKAVKLSIAASMSPGIKVALS